MKDVEDFIRRAYSAYFREKGNDEQPILRDSALTVCDELSFVVLRNDRDVKAVYRIRNDGQLKRLRRITDEQQKHFAECDASLP